MDILELRSLYSMVVLVNGLVFQVVVVVAATPWSVLLTGAVVLINGLVSTAIVVTAATPWSVILTGIGLKV